MTTWGPPPHARIAAHYRNLIHDGTYPPAAQLPSRSVVAAEFGVSTQTVQYAWRVLQGEGLIVGEQGRGTFVRRTPEGHRNLEAEMDALRARVDRVLDYFERYFDEAERPAPA